MARLLSQALSRKTPLSVPSSLASRTLTLTHHRYRSNKSDKAQLIEIELDSSSSSSDGGSEVEIIGLRKLEEVIHGIVARRSAPDWIPFVPGSSYWVPPRGGHNLVEVIGRFSSANPPLSDDEAMSLTTPRGWPSSAYFIQGNASMHPLPMEVEVEVTIPESDNASRPEDAE